MEADSYTHLADLAQETIDYADQIYLEFGADEHIEGLGHEEERKEIRRRAIQAGLKLVDCPIRHMGTEKAQGIYLAIEMCIRDRVQVGQGGAAVLRHAGGHHRHPAALCPALL